MLRTRLEYVVAAATACLAVASPASAESLVYLNADRNITIARPDGSGAQVVTSGGGYVSPSVDANGHILALRNEPDGKAWYRRIDRTGATLSGPWLVDQGLFGRLGPLWAEVAPDDGTVIAMLQSPGGLMVNSSYDLGTSMLAFSYVQRGTMPHFSGLWHPRWINNGSEMVVMGLEGPSGLGGTRSGWVNAQPNLTTPPARWLWVDPTEATINVVSASPSGNVLMMDQTPAGATIDGRHDLVLFTWGGTPGTQTATIADRCQTNGYATGSTNNLRWSRDGTRISWTAPDGVWVSPAPTPNGPHAITTPCTLSPKLVIPGASAAFWAPFDIPQASTPVSPTPSNPMPATPTPSRPTPASPPPAVAPAAALRIPVARLGNVARTGALAASCRLARGGTCIVTATISRVQARLLKLPARGSGPVVVGVGTVRLHAAGSRRVVVRMRPAARRALGRARSVRITFQVRATYAGGARTTTVVKVL